MVKQTYSFVLGGILAACLAAGAWAHEGGVIDLEALETYVAQQEAATAAGDPAIHKVWKKLDKTLDQRPNGKLSGDLAKVTALSKASNGTLVTDGTLRTLLDGALDAVDGRLANTPDDVATLIGQIKKQSSRDKVLAAVVAARTLHDEGTAARDAGDETGQLKLWKKADAAFARASKLARQIINKQGGPLPQFKVAAPGRVYTVAGLGLGGFNGDGKEARRTELYFVEECRFGPDGLLYILDWNNHMLRRRNADGRIERLCGSGIPGDSEGDPMKTDLNHPSSLAFDPTPGGKVYIAAWHNHKVKVYDPVGGPGGTPTVYTIAGTIQGGGTDPASGDGALGTSAKFNLLPGLVRLPSGDLLAADAANAVIRHIDLTPGVDAPNLVGTTVRTGTITRFAGTRGVSGITGDGAGALSCTLNFSKAQNADPDGRMELSPDGTKLFIICGQGHCIRVMDLGTGVIDRFAGTGTAGYAGDNGPAKDALLNRPSDIAISPDGTVYISDALNHVIRKVAPDGTISTYAGTAGTTGAAADDVPVAEVLFKHPAGLELDANGNLYVCDRENSVIRVITALVPGTTIQLPVAPYELPNVVHGGPPAKGAAGTIETYAGSGTLGFNGDGRPALDTDMYWPQDVAVDPNPVTGFLYIVDWNNHRIRRVENNGNVTTVVGSGLLGDAGGEGPDAKLNHPTDITFHPTTGDLWIAAWHTDKIIRLDSATNRIIYMAGNKRAFTGDGLAASNPITGSPTVGVAEMNIPASVKFTGNGDWYISDQGNERIRKVDGTTGVINSIVGLGTAGFSGDNGPGLSAEINLPVGQAAQPAGRVSISPDERWLYLADTGNNRIRRIDLMPGANHAITTYAGTGTAGFGGDGGLATLASLDYPTDVDCDAAGNLYIADQANNRIRRVDFVTKNITTIAGDGANGYSGDGSVATSARLSRPSGIHVVRTGATAGRIYVADTYNGVVRVIWE